MAHGAVSQAKEVAAALRVNPHTRVAFVGLSPLQKSTARLIAKSTHMNARFFKTVAEGQEWLVEDG